MKTNIFIITIALIIILVGYYDRGYYAVGSEILWLPVAFIVKGILKEERRKKNG